MLRGSSALLVLSAALCGCSSAPVMDPLVTGGDGGCVPIEPTFFFDGPVPVLVPGVESTVTLTIGKPAHCQSDDVTATYLQTTVSSPDNLPLEHSNTGAATLSDHYETQVTFTPTKPGWYHLTALFQPNLGLAQLDVPVALDHAMHEPLFGVYVSPAAAAGCLDFSLTAHDGVLCQTIDELVLFRGGVEQERLGSDRIAVSGDAVWRQQGNALQLHTDPGSGTLVPGPTVSLPEPGTALWASATEAVVAGALFAKRFVLENGALVEHGSWTFPADPNNNGDAIVASAGGDILMLSVFRQCTSSDEMTAACTRVGPYILFAYGPDGAWGVPPLSRTFERRSPGGGVKSITMPQGFQLLEFLQPRFGKRPHLTSRPRGNQELSVTDGPELFFVDWTPKPGFEVLAIAGDWAAMRSSFGEVVFVR